VPESWFPAFYEQERPSYAPQGACKNCVETTGNLLWGKTSVLPSGAQR